MLKEKWNLICNFVLKHSKIMLPILLIAVVAIVVSVALGANDSRRQEDEALQAGMVSVEAQPTAEPAKEEGIPQVPLTENTISELYTLICTYYNAYASGDVEAMKEVVNYVSDTDAISIPEMSKYVEQYPELTVYTKEGPVENSYLAYVYFKMKVTGFEDLISGMETFYVCTKEDGTLYLNKGEAGDEELEYIQTVSLQDDVVELYNRVTVECSDTFANNEDLYYYIQEVVNEVQKVTGEQLAAQISSESGDDTQNVEGEGTAEQPVDGEGQQQEEAVTASEEDGPIYAKATTTVNVRSSDSEQADKIDKITGGTKVEVLEQRVNGWSKVKVNGNEGYIKSEFLRVITVVGSGDAIGTVTATSNVNVRESASENAERLGMLAGGTEVDLLAEENGWCKINYNGQIGYVKADYVQ